MLSGRGRPGLQSLFLLDSGIDLQLKLTHLFLELANQIDYALEGRGGCQEDRRKKNDNDENR